VRVFDMLLPLADCAKRHWQAGRANATFVGMSKSKSPVYRRRYRRDHPSRYGHDSYPFDRDFSPSAPATSPPSPGPPPPAGSTSDAPVRKPLTLPPGVEWDQSGGSFWIVAPPDWHNTKVRKPQP
jgi:hypothetical protein